MSAFETIAYQVQERVALITLQRPRSHNAFNRQMRLELTSAIETADADSAVRVIVINAAGRNFSAGADLGEAAERSFDVQVQIETEYKPALLAIAGSTKPVISAVNGSAAGVGASLAMACDLTIMAEDASIYLAFATLAVVPDGGATWQLLNQLGRKRAFDLITSGGKLTAASCLELGLANRVVDAGRLLEQALAWALELAEMAPLALQHAKQALYQVAGMDLAEAISYEAGLQKICFGSDDFLEGMRAFQDKRRPVFQGR